MAFPVNWLLSGRLLSKQVLERKLNARKPKRHFRHEGYLSVVTKGRTLLAFRVEVRDAGIYAPCRPPGLRISGASVHKETGRFYKRINKGSGTG